MDHIWAFLTSDPFQLPAREILYNITFILALVVAINIELVESDGYKWSLRCLIWTVAIMYGFSALIVHDQRAYGLDSRDMLLIPALVGAGLLVAFFPLSRRRHK